MIEGDTMANSVKNNQSNICLSKSKEQLRAEKIYKVIEAVRENQGISVYGLSKVLTIPKTTLFFILRDLEFGGLVYSKLGLSELNHSQRLFYTYQNETKKNHLNVNSGEKPKGELNGEKSPDASNSNLAPKKILNLSENLLASGVKDLQEKNVVGNQ